MRIHLSSDWLIELACAAFFAILFLQSGLDKVFDRKGNLSWLTGHFAKSPFRSFVSPLLWALTGLELTAGVLSGLGVLQLIFARERTLAYWGALAATAALLSLFLGQRLAKDYDGAAGLVPYFLAALAAMTLLH